MYQILQDKLNSALERNEELSSVYINIFKRLENEIKEKREKEIEMNVFK